MLPGKAILPEVQLQLSQPQVNLFQRGHRKSIPIQQLPQHGDRFAGPAILLQHPCGGK
jgi:hypothetical protein